MNTKTTLTALMISLLLTGPVLAAKDSDGPVRQPKISSPSTGGLTSSQLPLTTQWHHENNH